MSVPQHVAVITLGVADLAASRAFYVDGLGWPVQSEPSPEIVFIQAGHGLLLGLYGAVALGEDAGVSGVADQPAGGRFSLASNQTSRDAVDELFQAAIAAGGTAIKQPEAAFWGGYSGYFGDPDGFWWEVAHNPGWNVTADGAIADPQ